MSLQSVRDFLNQHAPEITITPRDPEIIQKQGASQTGEASLAKTLCFSQSRQTILVVIPAALRLDPAKIANIFKNKPRMLSADEVVLSTGHPVQGVCPIGLESAHPIYFDTALRQYKHLTLPAGSQHFTFQITPDHLLQLTGAKWIELSGSNST